MRHINFTSRMTAMLVIAALSIGAFASSATADEYPSRPVQVVVGFSAGGGTDTWARIVAGLIHEQFDGMPFVVVNKTGAAGNVALEHVSRQPADGNVLFFHAVDFAISSELSGGSDISLRKELRAVAGLGVANAALFVPKDSPHKTLKDFIEHAKANPGEMRWSHAGRGGTHHLGFTKVLNSLGLDIPDVPFAGASKARAALIAKQVDGAIFNVQNVIGFEDKVRILGVLSAETDPTQPDVPTFKAQGYDVPNVYTAFGLYADKETPDEIVMKLEGAVQAVTKTKGYARLAKRAGFYPQFVGTKAADAQVADLYELLKP